MKRSQSAELHAKQFLEVMQAYQASLKDPKLSSLDLRGKHSWEDVFRAAKDAEAEYLKAGNKGLRRAGRITTAYADAVMPVLNLIPNGEFTSILCGGLKLVFGMSNMGLIKTALDADFGIRPPLGSGRDERS